MDLRQNHRRRARRPSSRLGRDILRTLLYFDIFQHPLTLEEIYKFLPSNSTSTTAIQAALLSQPLRAIIREDRSFFRLSTAGNQVVARRLENEERARHLWKIARFVGRLIALFPFVRGVFVSGELSKGVAHTDSDIDFVVVTAERRLWLCRTLLVLFKKIFLFNSRRYFCINHFMSCEHLQVEDRSVYAAVEVATLRAVVNPSLLRQLAEKNAWVEEVLPNARYGFDDHLPSSRPSRVSQSFEFLVPGKLADRLEVWVMGRWKKLWKKRYPHLPDEDRERLFRSTPYLSTAYGNDYLVFVQSEYNRRLAAFGLPRQLFAGLRAPVE